MRVSPDGWRYKVTPIDSVINDCKRRADDAWWDGNDDEARLHEAEAKLYEDDRERGVEWVPNFQHQHFLWYLHQLGLLVLSGYGQHILMTGDDDAEDKNAPFDDVTHWVGNLPSKDTDSTKRPVKRYSWWQTKSNILRKKLGVETKRED